MHGIFRGRRAFLPVILLAVLCCRVDGLAGPNALAAFLGGETAPEVREFGSFSREAIASLLQKLRRVAGKERAMAVGNLQHCAWIMLDTPAAVPAAIELLDVWIVPQVGCLRSLPGTSGCSWERVVSRAYASYKKAGHANGERRTLELLSTQARDPGLRDLAFLRLAGLKAASGDLPGAIGLARKCNPNGEFARAREQLISDWEKSLNES